MTNKKRGIVILAFVFVALLATCTFCLFSYANMKSELTILQGQKDCTEHEKTIQRLQTQLNELQNQADGARSNTKENISDKALFFLNTFYSENQSQKIKPLMTERAYTALYSSTTADEYQVTPTYKVTINNPKVYHNKFSDIKCDVLILADFNVSSTTGNTVSPFLFHIEMIYENGEWLVSDILQNTTIRYIS